mmetsp:Transcript_65026/g.146708  ORF Transcript_65026/g.146708 Transcript_65026/m.146708 type:complete len:232 (+) Transcript_65026:183-878(+)
MDLPYGAGVVRVRAQGFVGARAPFGNLGALANSGTSSAASAFPPHSTTPTRALRRGCSAGGPGLPLSSPTGGPFSLFGPAAAVPRSSAPSARPWRILRRSSLIKHATPTPALGSIWSFILDQTKRVALRMSSSSRVTTASTRSRTGGHVLGPSCVRRPSATVYDDVTPGSLPRSSPAFLLLAASSMAAGSAPTTSMLGHLALHAMAHPEMSPPPPTGTTSTSSGASSSWPS